MGNFITKIKQLVSSTNNEWKEYEIGAEARNVVMRNGNRARTSVQALLFKDMEPKEYIYGQDIYNAKDNIYEPLTWSNIKTWVNEGRVREFLKEGDCIIINNSGLSSSWHFYIIGINTNNGQSEEDLESGISAEENNNNQGEIPLQHIDFCGGSMLTLQRKVQLAKGLTTTSLFNTNSNNGDNEYYGNFYTDNVYFRSSRDHSDGYINDTFAIFTDITGLNISLIDPKILYLDYRMPQNFPFLQLLMIDNQFQMFHKIGDNLFSGDEDNAVFTSIGQCIQYFSSIYDFISRSESNTIQSIDEEMVSDLSPQEAILTKYCALLYCWNSMIGNNAKSANLALAFLRYSISLIEEDPFFGNDYITAFHALLFLRYSASLVDTFAINVAANDSGSFQIKNFNGQSYFIINNKNDDIVLDMNMLVTNKLDSKSVIREIVNVQDNNVEVKKVKYSVITGTFLINETSPRVLEKKYGNMIDLLDFLYEVCKKAKEIKNFYKKNSLMSMSDLKKRDSNISIPAYKIWGLTEKELFGECTYSEKEKTQGQIFQYPYFKDMAARKNILKDLQDKPMITITPLENSSTEAVGMDKGTLTPSPYDLRGYGTGIDMPICFRLQQRVNNS